MRSSSADWDTNGSGQVGRSLISQRPTFLGSPTACQLLSPAYSPLPNSNLEPFTFDDGTTVFRNPAYTGEILNRNLNLYLSGPPMNFPHLQPSPTVYQRQNFPHLCPSPSGNFLRTPEFHGDIYDPASPDNTSPNIPFDINEYNNSVAQRDVLRTPSFRLIRPTSDVDYEVVVSPERSVPRLPRNYGSQFAPAPNYPHPNDIYYNPQGRMRMPMSMQGFTQNPPNMQPQVNFTHGLWR